MKLLAFAASSSRKSINKQLVSYAANLCADLSRQDLKVKILDLNDFELPLFSEDKEAELGQPQLAKDFLNEIAQCDALIISFAEHNGSYTAAYKNIFDWASRINPKVYQDKPTIIFSTSPGARGGSNVLKAARNSLPHFSAKLKGSLAIPSFYDNFDSEKKCVTNETFVSAIENAIKELLTHL